MRVITFALFVSLLGAGCQKQNAKEKRYQDFDSLVNAQVTYLTRSKASLKKKATIGCKSDSTSIVPDSTTWSHELDVFRQLDLINRPIYRDAYIVKDRTKDSKSNLLILSYEAPPTFTVPYLRLFYQDSPKRLKKLEALYQESNSLYNTKRILKMYFDDSKGKPYLTGYTIDGNQKMMLSDSTHYTITAEITF
ncbi:MAG: hypothetical protein AABY93_19230 [Bacteroidota bacterium]